MNDQQLQQEAQQKAQHTAGAFDIRTFIAGLMGLFGLILLGAGFFGPERTADSVTEGGPINIGVGIALLVFAALMQGWAMWRPTVVDAPASEE